jgi:S-formylglutathione hydrolase FrmB/predicted MFS family arabinose efflux permease
VTAEATARRASPHAPVATDSAEPDSAARPRLLLAGVCLGGMVVGLDGTAITIAAPSIARSTAASLADLTLIANVYLVMLAVCILPAGRLADRVGRRAIFVVGALGFGACSLGISVSTTVGELAAFRAGQGVFAALLQPTALALLSTAFARERLGSVLGIWGAVNALAIGLGPVFAGFVVAGFGWPAVFLVNVPVALLAVILVRVAAQESRARPSTRPLRTLLGQRAIRVATALVAMSSFAVFGLLFLLTLYLQNVHGLTPSAAGAWLLAPTMAVVIGAPVGGLLAERIGPRWPVVIGMLAVVVGLVGLDRVSAESGYWAVAAPAILFGLGTGAWVIAATSTIVGDGAGDLAGMASAVQQAASQLGGVLGVAVIAIVVSIRVGDALGARLHDAGVSRLISDAVLRSRDLVAEGRAPVPHGASGHLRQAVRAASHLAFTAGMHTAFLASAALIMLAAPLGLLLGGAKARADRSRGDDAPRARTTPASAGGPDVEVLSDVARGERLRELTLRSRALGRPASVLLLTPRGFSTSSSRRWPVLVLLHGADDGPSSWTREAALVERSEELDALVVMPEAGPIGFYTDWQHPDATGSAPRWEGFHLDEVPYALEAGYRAGPTRVVAGVSMGGYGAIAYAAKRPGMFAAAASYSGLLHITRRGMPAFIATMLLREREQRNALWGSPRRHPERWLANDPYHLAERLQGTALYLSCADGRALPTDDVPPLSGMLERWVAPTTESLATRLAALGIPATVIRGHGAHEWSTWRRELDRSWPFLLTALGCDDRSW